MYDSWRNKFQELPSNNTSVSKKLLDNLKMEPDKFRKSLYDVAVCSNRENEQLNVSAHMYLRNEPILPPKARITEREKLNPVSTNEIRILSL